MSIRRRFHFGVAVFLLLAAVPLVPGPQQAAKSAPEPQNPPLQHEVRVVNVEVPVRVFKGESFVDGLTLGDFEVLENGVPQDIEAVYLVRDRAVARKEQIRAFSPDTSRTFFLFFVIYEYDARLRDALRYFVDNVLRPEDQLFVVTSRATYRLKKELLAAAPKNVIIEQLSSLVRRDILVGETAYRSLLSKLKQMSGSRTRRIEDQMTDPGELAEAGFSSRESYMMQYRSDLDQLEQLRQIDESKLFNFADHLKNVQGQKHVFLFYQREFVPTPDQKKLAGFANDPVLSQMSADIADFYKKTTSVAIDRLKSAYADSTVTIHFLYLTTAPTDISRDQMEERQWDVYEVFSGMAKATGGVISSSSNSAALMEKAATASENYYLLYYSPKDKTTDGKFRQIEVKVKSGSYRVEHVAGYLAK
jgi:VWFA-related protein